MLTLPTNLKQLNKTRKIFFKNLFNKTKSQQIQKKENVNGNEARKLKNWRKITTRTKQNRNETKKQKDGDGSAVMDVEGKSGRRARISEAASVKNKTKESLVLQHVRFSYRFGHSCQPAVLFEKDGSSTNTVCDIQ